MPGPFPAPLPSQGKGPGNEVRFTVYFFDIGHPCYEQLTHVKTKYLLTTITWPFRRLKSTTHRGHVFKVDR